MILNIEQGYPLGFPCSMEYVSFDAAIHYRVIKRGSVYRGSPVSLFHKNLLADHSVITFNRYGTCGITDNGIHIFTAAGDGTGYGTVRDLKD